jgi:hypothetical protein
LSGNLAEWTGEIPAGLPGTRAAAGGHWDAPSTALSPGSLIGLPPTDRSDRTGLRLARSVSAALASALDGAGLEWDSGGVRPWFAQTGQTHDGIDGAAAGPLTGSESNWVETKASGPANLSFRWKTRLPTGTGALILLVDGVERSRLEGVNDWSAGSIYLPAGSHAIRWRFERIAPTGAPPIPVTGENGAWLDEAALVPAVLPQVVTGGITLITEDTATGAGDVTGDGGSPVTARGLVLATTPSPAVETGLVYPATDGGPGAYECALTSLLPGTTYRFRSYATNEVGTAYGSEGLFTTDEFVPLIDGIATRGRVIESGDRQVFHFTLSGPRETVFSTTGGAALRAELYDGSGALIASFGGDSDFSFGGPLRPGNYSLHVLRTSGGGAPQSYTLGVDATVEARTLPDVAVGPTLATLTGAGVRGNPAGQSILLVSRRAFAVTAEATVANEGTLADRFRVFGTGGSRLFSVFYTAGSANVTAAIITGTHETGILASGDQPESIRLQVVPNRRLLRERSGRRTVIRRKTHPMLITATSEFNGNSSDTVRISVTTR